MSQIYNGTFVLGDTSATTISAGQGIAVDEFTPGVIGIRTDETVLYSGTYNTNTTAINLSETLDNFESFKVLWDHFGTNEAANKKWVEYTPETKQCNCYIGRATNTSSYNQFVTFWGNNKTSLSKIYCGYSTCTSETQGTVWHLVNEVIPIKVVGINRKGE